MTNWLDPAEVRAEAQRRRDEWNSRYSSKRDTYDDEDSKDEWWGPVKDQDKAGMSWNVLEAIAALPEPKEQCERCHAPQESDIHKTENHSFGFWCHAYEPSTLHRIWRIARIVCGKEYGREG